VAVVGTIEVVVTTVAIPRELVIVAIVYGGSGNFVLVSVALGMVTVRDGGRVTATVEAWVRVMVIEGVVVTDKVTTDASQLVVRESL
jgi:hypothetical protein